MNAVVPDNEETTLPALGQPSAPLPPFAAVAGLEPGKVALLVTPLGAGWQTLAVLILEAVRAGPVLIFSGDGRVPAYELLKLARAEGIESLVADGVIVTRAFTVHQLATLLEIELPALVESRFPNASLVLVPGLLRMFEEDEINPGEARAILGHVLRRVTAWAQAQGVPVLALAEPGRDVRGMRGVARRHVARVLEPPEKPLPPVPRGQARLLVE